MKFSVKNLVMMAIGLAIIIICSKISIPIGPIPLTLQTLSIFICSLILGSIKSGIVIGIYIILGLIGLPVFSSGGGFMYIFSPSFGFIVGFLFAGMVVGLAAKSDKFYLKYILGVVGLLIINIFGVIHMYIIFNYYMSKAKDIISILQIGVLPFIIKDFIVVILSCIIYSRIQPVIYKNNSCSYIEQIQ